MSDYNSQNMVLTALLSDEIPQKKIYKKGFLHIIKRQTKETTISNLYSYFINHENIQISSLFLQSLLSLIEKKTGKVLLAKDFVCITETRTKKGNFIDLYICSLFNQYAIIIENKIFHWLHNDLVDYWEYCPYPEKQKVGVLLTLKPEQVPVIVENIFINITHNEWITEILDQIPNDLPQDEFIYLSDFINNMLQISASLKMNPQTKFFFENTLKVKLAVETFEEAKQFVITQFEKIKLHGYDFVERNPTRFHYFINKKYPNIYYAIFFEPLFKGQRDIKIIIELSGKAILKDMELKSLLSSNKLYTNLKIDGDRKQAYVHFAMKDYKLTEYELENFGDFLSAKINEDFSQLISIVQEYCKPSTKPLE